MIIVQAMKSSIRLPETFRVVQGKGVAIGQGRIPQLPKLFPVQKAQNITFALELSKILDIGRGITRAGVQ